MLFIANLTVFAAHNTHAKLCNRIYLEEICPLNLFAFAYILERPFQIPRCVTNCNFRNQ